MEESKVELKHSELTEKIIGIFFDVYNELGHGFLEAVYAEAMVLALEASGLHLQREVQIRVHPRKSAAGER